MCSFPLLVPPLSILLIYGMRTGWDLFSFRINLGDRWCSGGTDVTASIAFLMELFLPAKHFCFQMKKKCHFSLALKKNKQQYRRKEI